MNFPKMLHRFFRNRFFCQLLCLLVVVLVGYALLTSPNIFPVKKVVIKGAENDQQQQRLQSIIAPIAAKGFFGANIGVIKEEVLSLNWVRSVSVSRVWPNELFILVDDRQEIASWNDNGVVTASGQVYYPENKQNLEKLPKLTGPSAQLPLILKNFQKMNDILIPIGLNITHMSLTSYNDWKVVLSDGMEVELGDQSPTETLQKFVKIYQQAFAKENRYPVYVDMRYSHGLAVKWTK